MPDGEATNCLVPELTTLLNLWRRRYRTRPIPERSLLSEKDLESWSRNLAWIEHALDGRFHVRKFGINLIRRFGREATSHYIDDLAKDIAFGLRGLLWHTIMTGAPAHAYSSVEFGYKSACFCDLILPTARNNGRIALLLIASNEL